MGLLAFQFLDAHNVADDFKKVNYILKNQVQDHSAGRLEFIFKR